jgi:hypothetical protein
MIAWSIFKKSVSQVWYNFSAAIKISGPLWLIAFFASTVLIYTTSGSLMPQTIPMDGSAQLSSREAGGILLSILLQIIAFTWIAVAWHRYMLLGELGSSMLPAWRGNLIWSYFAKSLLIGLLMVIAMIIPMMILTLLTVAGLLSPSAFALIVPIVLAMLATYISLGVSLVLPGVALQKPMGFGKAWTVTKPLAGQIALLALFIMAVSTLLHLVTNGLATLPVLAMILSFFVGWAVLMLSVTVLTTLYGHLVEGRSL